MSGLRSYMKRGRIEAGCDEAGRGCLAGPVVAAAVILPRNWDPGLNDSKKLSASKRGSFAEQIKEHALSWGIGVVDHREIDEINILNASFLAMHRALDQLELRPEFILVDGNRFHPYKDITHECIVKGDGKFRNIAAASILAKTYRDEIMEELGQSFPHYGWSGNKGYPTKEHRSAIATHGPSPYHRLSFRLLPDQLSLFD